MSDRSASTRQRLVDMRERLLGNLDSQISAGDLALLAGVNAGLLALDADAVPNAAQAERLVVVGCNEEIKVVSYNAARRPQSSRSTCSTWRIDGGPHDDARACQQEAAPSADRAACYAAGQPRRPSATDRRGRGRASPSRPAQRQADARLLRQRRVEGTDAERHRQARATLPGQRVSDAEPRPRRQGLRRSCCRTARRRRPARREQRAPTLCAVPWPQDRRRASPTARGGRGASSPRGRESDLPPIRTFP
jgi:hypothetical protein